MAISRHLQHLSGLLLLLLLLAHGTESGKWIVSVKTSNNWLAGFVGDVNVCLTLRATKPVVPKLPPTTTTATSTNGSASETTDNNFPTLDDNEEELDAGDQPSDEPESSPAKEECQSLPWRLFERGKPYLFGLDYETAGNKIDRARIFAKSSMEDGGDSCRRNSVDVWHIDDITFQNLESGQLFEKKRSTATSAGGRASPKPMQIEAKCGANANKDLVLESFVVSLHKRPCVYDSAIYRDGESFEDGCSAACRCQDGGIGCVSRCPPSLAPGCREVYLPGQCCPTFACEKVAKLSCPLYENNDCETANRTVDPGEYPWTAFVKLCGAKGCKRFCSGALVSEQWILSASDCFVGERGGDRQVAPDDVRVIVGEHTLILAEDRDVEIGVQNITFSPSRSGGGLGHLALVKLKEPVVFDRAAQPATLPVNREQCQALTQPSCGLTLAGWINIGLPEQEQYELYKISTRIEEPRVCDHHQTAPQSANGLPQSSRKRKPPPPSSSGAREGSLCIDLANDEPALQPECGACSQQSDNSSDSSCPGDKNAYLCTGEKGRTLVSKVQVASPGEGGSVEVNYLVGIISYGLSAQETTSVLCRKTAYRMALGVCQDLNWITATINEND